MAEEGHIPPRDHGREEAPAPMEYETPPEILPIGMTFDFPSLVHFYLISFWLFLKALTSLFIVFGFLYEKTLATMNLLVSFSTALNLMKEHSRQCYVLTTKVITTKSTDPTRVKLTSPQSGRIPPRVKRVSPQSGRTKPRSNLQVHKVDGSHQGSNL